MTPERIAELSEKQPFEWSGGNGETESLYPEWHEMLDEISALQDEMDRQKAEIERLRSLVLRTHERVTWRVYGYGLTTAECTCGRLYKTHVSAEEADALFAVHVAETLSGGAS